MPEDIAISLGPNCRAKYQLRRLLGDKCPNIVFDWQVTPPAALIEYLERDFTGLFSVSDLEIHEGIVRNRRFDTLHLHEFSQGLSSTPELLAQYAEARARHDYLCDRTKRLLRGDTALLLVLSERVASVGDIEAALRRYNPELQFTLLDGPDDSTENWRGNDALWTAHLEPFLGRTGHL